MAKTTPSRNEESLEQHVRAKIESLAYLPTSLAVAMKFVELGKNRDADPADYVRVISADSSLVAKVLSLANSSWFGIRNRVTRPLVAINLLGLGTVRTLAISYCLTGLHNSLRLTPDEARSFWTASLCKAVAARRYAQMYHESVAEEAFTAGLLQDVGLPIMFSEARQVVSSMMRDNSLPVNARLGQEAELFAIDHAEVGRLVAHKLGLPDFFINIIAHHHDHACMKGAIADPVTADAVYVASLFPHALSGWNPRDVEDLRQHLASNGHGPAVDVKVFLSEVQQQFDQIRGYFEQGDKMRLSLEELLESASTQLADVATHLVGSVQAAMQWPVPPTFPPPGSPAHGPAQPLPSTPVSRQEFEQQASRWLQSVANRRGDCLAMVAIERPRSAGASAEEGQQISDAIAAALRQSTRQCDIVGEYAGDAYTILVPDCSSADADQVVRRIQTALSHGTTPSGSPLSVSVGYLWIGPAFPSYPLSVLIRATDRLMHEARRASETRVRRGSITQPDLATA